MLTVVTTRKVSNYHAMVLKYQMGNGYFKKLKPPIKFCISNNHSWVLFAAVAAAVAAVAYVACRFCFGVDF